MLTDTQIKSFKPKEKLYRKTDSHGLTLEIAVSGSKIWRLRYRFDNKYNMMTLGYYPGMSLLDARQSRDKNKQLIKQGFNPKEHKNVQEVNSLTFKDMFVEWHHNKKDEWSDNYAHDVIQRAECYLIPFIGSKPIGRITAPEILRILKDIESRDLIDTLGKIKGIASRVFSYAVGMGVITVNPVRDLPNDVFKKKKQKHYATITDPKEIGWLLRTIEGHKGSYQVRNALIMAPYVFLRPGELVNLTWDEVDFNDRIIRVKGARMKMKKDHLIPMSGQVLDILKNLSYIETNSNYVFSSPRNKNKPITTNALLVSIRSLGISKEQFTTHGYRHMASTRLNELGYRSDVIERQLSHTEPNKVKAAYNHAEHLDNRKKMMNEWGDYLDQLKSTYA